MDEQSEKVPVIMVYDGSERLKWFEAHRNE